MLKISHLPRIMIRMKRKGKAAVGGRVYQRSVCRYHEAKYPARPDIRDDASIVPYRLHLGQYRIILSADTASEVRQMLSQSADNTGCLIEHFGNADAVPQPPERCLSR